ncbi:MAG: SRPBCC family protein [Alphaproteobacteria bacterium]|nr:SRPBCC family protein [Alphaproteobacteria bacterium]
MKLENAFEVPLPPDEAWAVLRDIERIAPCMPGAAITEVLGPDEYKGTVALRLGPVGLSFAGKAAFIELDDAGRCARVKAQGADTKGRGGAVAEVTFRVVPAQAGARVEIETDLNLSGSIAQYGRGPGIIQATAEQLIGEFAENLRAQIAQSGGASGAADAAPAAGDGPGPGDEATAAGRVKAEVKPIAGFALMFRVIRTLLKRLFGGGR